MRLSISLKKMKEIPIRRYEPVSDTTEKEMKHKCPACSRTFPTQKGLNIHRARPDGPERSRKGSLADTAVKHAKRVELASQQPRVSVNGHQLENVLYFDYLGCSLSGDGDDRVGISHRMHIAQERFTGLQNIWCDNRLQTSLKLELYSPCVYHSHTEARRGL